MLEILIAPVVYCESNVKLSQPNNSISRNGLLSLICLIPPSLSSAKLSDRDTEQGTCWNDKREAT